MKGPGEEKQRYARSIHKDSASESRHEDERRRCTTSWWLCQMLQYGAVMLFLSEVVSVCHSRCGRVSSVTFLTNS
jgi:hypothetical protein